MADQTFWAFRALLLVCFIGLFPQIPAAQESNMPGKQEPTLIGISLPLTGEIGQLAKMFLAGAQLALDDFNKTRVTNKASLMVADDGCSAEMAKLAVEELADSKVDLITGFLCNDAAIIAANTFRQNKTPLLIAGARSRRLSADRRREGWHLWQLSPQDGMDAHFLAGKLAKRWSGKKIAVIDDGTTFARVSADIFATQLTTQGFEDLFRSNFSAGLEDYGELLESLRKKGINHIYVGGTLNDIILMSRNAAAAGYSFEMAGPENLALLPASVFQKSDTQIVGDGDSATSTGEIAMRPLFVGLSYQTQDFPKTQEILKRARKRGYQSDIIIAQGYQAMQVAVLAVGKNFDATAKRLSSQSFDTIFGPVQFGKKGELITSPYRLYRWNGKQFLLEASGE